MVEGFFDGVGRVEVFAVSGGDDHRSVVLVRGEGVAGSARVNVARSVMGSAMESRVFMSSSLGVQCSCSDDSRRLTGIMGSDR